MPQFDVPIWVDGLIGGVWTALLLCFSLFGLNYLWLAARAWYCRRRRPAQPGARDMLPPDQWPSVTVQIPIYNEVFVVERIIDACARLDYPRDRLEIQVLDDSGDETRQLAQARVAYWRAQGVDIKYLSRNNRVEFKAGALNWGVQQAAGDFLALFDADFQPKPDFLYAAVGFLLRPENRGTGFVQTRWDIGNACEGFLTRALSLAVNGHFGVEVKARSQAGLWFGFNGSAGVWRKTCVEDPRVGGWSGATLCEDLHLSYRAQMAGWKGAYLEDVSVPADVPLKLAEFRLQQFRWAKGSWQALQLLLTPILKARGFSLGVRLQSLFHLGAYLQHALLLGMLLLALPTIVLQVQPPIWLLWSLLAILGPVLAVGYGQWRVDRTRWWGSMPALAPLLFIGVGLCLTATLAISEALRGKQSPFERTPKGSKPGRGAKAYGQNTRLLENRLMPLEWLLALYCLAAFAASFFADVAWVWPLPLCGLCSLSVLAVWSLWERRAAALATPPRARPRAGPKRMRPRLRLEGS